MEVNERKKKQSSIISGNRKTFRYYPELKDYILQTLGPNESGRINQSNSRSF